MRTPHPIRGAFLASFLAIIASPLAAAQDSCQHASLVPSTHLSCSALGPGDLLSTIGPHARPPLAVDALPGGGNPHFPWTSEPLCTPPLDALGGPLCVYTNTSFAAGRGISVFTTPAIAASLALLPPFQDPAALSHDINAPSGPWTPSPIPGKGTGLLATQPLDRGTLITAYTPALLAHREQALSTRARETFLRAAVDRLPRRTRAAYLGLATIYGDPAVVAQDVLKANTFEVQVGGAMHLAVYPETARINHDCGPNAQYLVNHTLLTHFVRAARPIAEGEEITISYTNPFAPHATRQESLEHAFHFTCACARCLRPARSDAALARMDELKRLLSDFSPASASRTTAPELAAELIELTQRAGLHGFLDAAYGHAVMAASSVGDADGVRAFAGLAREAVGLKDGVGVGDWGLWERLERKPEGHWSWRARVGR